MKLIDLLVQELPKCGGWPDGYDLMSTNRHGWVSAYKNNGCVSLFELCIYSSEQGVVTRDQYEAALGESQKAKWNGEGLPPVGCECEYLDNSGEWYQVIIKYASDQLVVISGVTKILGVEQGTEIAKDIIIDKPQFRPLQTESERKRDEAVEAIDFYMPEFIPDTPNEFYHAKKIYDAIAAGKIPGVKLDD